MYLYCILRENINTLITCITGVATANCHTVQSSEASPNLAPFLFGKELSFTPQPLQKLQITFAPRSVDLDFDLPRRGTLINIIESPIPINRQIEEPAKIIYNKEDVVPDKTIELPTQLDIVEKQAVRMIIIRRKKMKKHKRRKLIKKMKFVWRKKLMKRRKVKQNAYEDELDAIYQKALDFDAKKYVAQRLHELTREHLPTRWQGEIIPESMIRQFMKERDDRRAAAKKLRTYRMKLD